MLSLLPTSCSRKDSQTWAMQVMLMDQMNLHSKGVEHCLLFGCFAAEQNGHFVTQRPVLVQCSNFLSISINYNLMNQQSYLKNICKEADTNLLLVKLYAELLSWYFLFALLRLVIVMSLSHYKYFTNFTGSWDFFLVVKWGRKKRKKVVLAEEYLTGIWTGRGRRVGLVLCISEVSLLHELLWRNIYRSPQNDFYFVILKVKHNNTPTSTIWR